MQAGLPVIATSTEAPREIIRHDQTGALVPAGQPEMLASALLAWLHQPDTARTVGASAQREVQQRFSRSVIARTISRIINRVIARQQRA
jgi:glycosyltransferase involved in cell wall biosynthesis